MQMSFQDPRSEKVAELCELKDEIGRWQTSQNDFLKEDYRFLKAILNDALDNPSEWSLRSDSVVVELVCQKKCETVIVDTSKKTYIWSQHA